MLVKRSGLQILATDGLRLGATLFEPAAPVSADVVVIHSAAGVRRRFYDAFASHLAGRGVRVLTFDYRGVGDSIPAPLRKFRVRIREWGEKDARGVHAWVLTHFPAGRLLAIGHSVGGQMLALSAIGRIERVMLVASCSMYWRAYEDRRRYLLWSLYRTVPLIEKVLGYFPGRALRFGENLPRGIATDWASWCLDPNYMMREADSEELKRRFEAVRCPILSFEFADDEIACHAGVRAVLDLYGAERITHRRIEPGEVGERRIGHFGFFRAGGGGLWDSAVAWLLAGSSEGVALMGDITAPLRGLGWSPVGSDPG